MVKKPTAVNIRAYNVGFGDCFLMIFEYGPKETDEKRCVLVDFGSTGRTPKMRPTVMNDVANDISDYVTKHCGGVLHGVVATHRHKDHISGYSGKSGKIIEKIKPKIVIQPWTEDPLAKRGAKSATAQSGKGGSVKGLAGLTNQYLQSLTDMHAFSASALAAASPRVGKLNEEKIKFIADDNLANREAIERLARMGKAGKAEYLHAGDKTKLEKLLPGVKVHVLGPPDLTQTESILKQRSSDKDEFWQFMQFWSMHAGSGGGKAISGKLFPRAKTETTMPVGTRWFIDRANRQMGHQLLGLVRILDQAMNNTSVILLFEVGDKKLLFPGDAQIENWAYVLSKPEKLPGSHKLLADVDLYKVGHHGSRNATPKTLWNGFKHRSDKATKRRLTSVVSTMPGKHGDPKKHTEVPRKSLLVALEGESNFHTTEDLPKEKGLFEPVHIDIN